MVTPALLSSCNAQPTRATSGEGSESKRKFELKAPNEQVGGLRERERKRERVSCSPCSCTSQELKQWVQSLEKVAGAGGPLITRLIIHVVIIHIYRFNQPQRIHKSYKYGTDNEEAARHENGR